MTQLSAFPTAIRPVADERRFVGYSVTGGKKTPIDPATGRAARTNDPRTWATLKEVRAWAARTGGHVGVVAGDLLVIDLDGAIGADGVFHAWVEELVALVGAEADVSVSGRGLHLYPELVGDDELRDLLAERKVFRDVPIAGVEFRTGAMGCIVGEVRIAATKPPAEQTAAVKELLRRLHVDRAPAAVIGPRAGGGAAGSGQNMAAPKPGHAGSAGPVVKLDTVVWGWAKARGIDRDYATLLFLKRHAAGGAGWLELDGALAALERTLGATRKHARKAAQRRLDLFLTSPFCQLRPNKDTGRTVVALLDPTKLVPGYVPDPRGRVAIPAAELLRRDVRGRVYLKVAARRDAPVDRPLPTSRSARCAMSGASPSTQRRAERVAGVVVLPQYALGERPGRRVVRTSRGPAYRIPNATVIETLRGCGQPRTGGVQADHDRRYVHGEAGEGKEGQLQHLGNETIAGAWAGLWEPVA